MSIKEIPDDDIAIGGKTDTEMKTVEKMYKAEPLTMTIVNTGFSA